jgi:predicted site-specific integrase-resolvase
MQSTIAAHTSGTRAYPIREGITRLGLGTTTAYEFIKSGKLETFLVGRARFVTEDALQKFVRERIAETNGESATDRAAKVDKAVAARTRQRNRAAA